MECGVHLLLDSGGLSSQLKTEQRLQLRVETGLTITGRENCIQHAAPPHRQSAVLPVWASAGAWEPDEQQTVVPALGAR